jgi:hypothetical protein
MTLLLLQYSRMDFVLRSAALLAALSQVFPSVAIGESHQCAIRDNLNSAAQAMLLMKVQEHHTFVHATIPSHFP